MELIRRVASRLYIGKKQRHYVQRGLFRCGQCNAEVERYMYCGLRQHTCGCRHWCTTHGMANTRLYQVWSGMRTRCTNKNEYAWHRYGGRGIKVDKEWDSFPAFRSWALANGYSDSMELDRIDNDGDYKPSNCRFVSHVENVRNSTTAKLTLNIVRHIRASLRLTKLTHAGIGRVMGVTKGTISKIAEGKTWEDPECRHSLSSDERIPSQYFKKNRATYFGG